MHRRTRECNVAVVGDCGHGKSTLINAVAKREPLTGYGVDTAMLSIARITAEEESPWRLNLVDTPGIIDRTGEVNAALSLVDTALLVVDCVDGVGLHVEKTLRSMIKLGVRPLVLINKLDVAIDEWDTERIHQACFDIVVTVNTLLNREIDNDKWRVDPTNGTVLFGSASGGWGFSLKMLGKELATRFNLDEQQMARKLWGSWAFDPESGDWSDVKMNPINRAFCELVIRPLANHKRHISQTSGATGCTMQARYPLRRMILKTLQHFALDSSLTTLPPSQTNEGDDRPRDVRTCNRSERLIILIARMVVAKSGQLVAIGRVLSGQITSKRDVSVFVSNDMSISFLESPYTRRSVDRYSARIECVGRLIDGILEVAASPLTAGELCALTGLETLIRQCALVTNSGFHPTPWLSQYLLSVSISLPFVVRVSIRPTCPQDKLKITECLLTLSRGNPSVRCSIAGDLFFISCLTEEQLAEFIDQVTSMSAGSASLDISEPMLIYRETIEAKSSRTCQAFSPNGHIEILCRADQVQVGGECAEDDTENIDPRHVWHDNVERSKRRQLMMHCSRLPEEDHMKESIIEGFRFSTVMGALCEEELTNIRIHIDEVSISGMEQHWESSQLQIAMRRGVYACQLLSAPALMEPYLEVELRCPHSHLSACMSVLRRHQCVLAGFSKHLVSSRLRIWLRAVEMKSILIEVNAVTARQVTWQYSLHHFQNLEGDPTDPMTKSGAIVRSLRAWKGIEGDVIKGSVPEISSLLVSESQAEYEQKMVAMHDRAFKDGSYVCEQPVETEEQLEELENMKLSIKTATFSRSGWLHRDDEWCFLESAQYNAEKQRFEKLMSTLSPQEVLASGHRKAKTRGRESKYFRDVIAGYRVEAEHIEEGANVEKVEQGLPTVKSRVHFYGELTGPVTSATSRFSSNLTSLARNEASCKAMKQRLLQFAKNCDRLNALVRRRRLSMQVLVDERRVLLPSTNTKCFSCEKNQLLGKLCRVCGQNVCGDCSSKYERETVLRKGPATKERRVRIETVRVCDPCLARVESADYSHVSDGSLVGPGIVSDNRNSQGTKTAKSDLKELLRDALLQAPSTERQASVMNVIRCVLDQEKTETPPLTPASTTVSSFLESSSVVLTPLSSDVDYVDALDYLDVKNVVGDEAEVSGLEGRGYAVDTKGDIAAPLKFPVPENEEKRVSLIEQTGVLDRFGAEQGPWDELNIICDIAAKELGAFASIVTIVTAEEQLVVASNLPALENMRMKREDSFCQHALMDNKPLIVPHPEADIRFNRIMPVTGMGLRYYCGFPLFVGDDKETVVGTLCCVDQKTHELTESQYSALQKLADTASKVVKIQGERRRGSSSTMTSSMGPKTVETSPEGPIGAETQPAAPTTAL